MSAKELSLFEGLMIPLTCWRYITSNDVMIMHGDLRSVLQLRPESVYCSKFYLMVLRKDVQTLVRTLIVDSNLGSSECELGVLVIKLRCYMLQIKACVLDNATVNNKVGVT